MIHSSTFKYLTIAGVCLGGLLGCADAVTYSKDTQHTGMQLYNEGSYPEAAGAFRNATRQNPRDYRNYYFLGASYEQMQQYQQSIHAYRTALNTLNISMAAKEDDDFRTRIINGLGRAIARSDMRDLETDAAVRDAETKGGAENWFIVAKIHAFRGDADSAIDAYNRAALLEPQNFMILRDYGLYLEQVGQTRQAEVPLRRAYALNNRDEQVTLALRRLGVVPGPSLKSERELVKPPVPKGPIPELELSMDGFKRSRPADPAAAPGSTVAAPKD